MIRPATPADAPALAEIYNAAVRETTAIWNDIEVDAENRRAWMAARAEGGFPVLVCEEGGAVLGYASYGPFRAFDGYRATVEHSVYVRKGAQGGGRGRALMEALIAEARARGAHIMVAAIEAGNAGSIALHASLGFEPVGRMPEVGQKFGRWLDLALMQLRLDTRAQP
ncbi:GNAT family N-acetyltransferase [Rhodobacter xanthinilyticus]|nr:GNAT family N-acetyltransferase [Rhodobacter xanthinilyticus]